MAAKTITPILPVASILQNIQYAVQRLREMLSYLPPHFRQEGIISLMCLLFSVRMLAMTFSPSPVRGCLLRGRGSPERRIPCFKARESDAEEHVQEILGVAGRASGDNHQPSGTLESTTGNGWQCRCRGQLSLKIKGLCHASASEKEIAFYRDRP